MKQNKIVLLFFIIICNAIHAQSPPKKVTVAGFELKQYFFVMLSKGPNQNQDSAIIAQTMKGHLTNILRLEKMGKLVLSGAFPDAENWVGIHIFDCKTEAEVINYLKADPAITTGKFTYKIYRWNTLKNNCLFK